MIVPVYPKMEGLYMTVGKNGIPVSVDRLSQKIGVAARGESRYNKSCHRKPI